MEYITVNGVEYAAKSVATTTNQIVMTFESCQIAEMEAAFRRALALTVSGEDKVVYGTYTGLAFEQAAVLAMETLLSRCVSNQRQSCALMRWRRL